MNSEIPTFLNDLADAVDGTIHEVGALPDGSGFATMSFALREDHWLYERTPEGYAPLPKYHMLAPKQSLAREYLEPLVMDAVRYGVKCATLDGREDDFDPDALVGQARNGLFGLHTETGLSTDVSDRALFDPPNPGSLGKVLLEALTLALHDGLVSEAEVHAALTPEAIQGALARIEEVREQNRREHEAFCEKLGIVPTSVEDDPV